LDGEIIAVEDGILDFEALQNLLVGHGRATPMFVPFDVLWLGGDMRGMQLSDRRAALEGIDLNDKIIVMPQTLDHTVAEAWLTMDQPGLEGVVAKKVDSLYRPGARGWVKVKRWDTADLIVGGYTGVVGEPRALLLGAYDAAGRLHHVATTAPLPVWEQTNLRAVAKELHGDEPFTGTRPGWNRWNSHRIEEWVSLKPRLVCEVSYSRKDGSRFRHSVRFLRWRLDKEPSECVLI
jgi:ATP-dependent DNA ligase